MYGRAPLANFHNFSLEGGAMFSYIFQSEFILVHYGWFCCCLATSCVFWCFFDVFWLCSVFFLAAVHFWQKTISTFLIKDFRQKMLLYFLETGNETWLEPCRTIPKTENVWERGGDMTTGFPNQWVGKLAQAKALLSKLDWFWFWFVLVCVYICLLAPLNISYMPFFFFFGGGGWGVHTFFCDVKCKLGGVISKSGRNVWRQFPNKKCRQGENVCNVGEVPPPPIYMFKGAGRENLSKSKKNNFQRRKPIKILVKKSSIAKTYQNPRKITFKDENLSKSKKNTFQIRKHIKIQE